MDSKIELRDDQKKAVSNMHNGCILCGGVGSGKTLTSLEYYRRHYLSKRLLIFTTAKKRDTKDWEKEANLLGISDLVVDSWNNITKYKNVKDHFIIFDEQKARGTGPWARIFIKIAKQNNWVLLSATPGDKWIDYAPVMIANGFYKNFTHFKDLHVEYNAFVSYPSIKKYHNIKMLEYIRSSLLVNIDYKTKTIRNRNIIKCNFNKDLYSRTIENRWNYLLDKPFLNSSAMIQNIRYIVNTDIDRIKKATDIIKTKNRIIVFYNFDYELDILIAICESLNRAYFQYNGHKHDKIPETKEWIYLVHYSSSEAWNCITTDSVLFYSLNYSYWTIEQCEGRIDRSNTKYKNLYYYYLESDSSIDIAIKKSIYNKKKFNEVRFINEIGK